MVSAAMLCKKILNVKGLKVENCTFREDTDGVQRLDLEVRPTKPCRVQMSDMPQEMSEGGAFRPRKL